MSTIVIAGLTNQGNTCYLNSALQFLMSSNLFIEFITYTTILDTTVCQYKSLIQQYNRPQSTIVDTCTFVACLHGDARLRYFSNHQQHDAHDFLVKFIDLFTPITLAPQTTHPILVARNLQYTDSTKVMKTLFNNNINTTVTCNACGYNSTTTCHEKTISIPITGCLNGHTFQTTELLTDWKCDRCEGIGNATLSTTIQPKAKYLIINLKRYQRLATGQLRKINTSMEMPLTWKNKYYLRAFIYHSGQINGGHYVCYRNINSKWYLCNDSTVTPVADLSRKNIGLVYLYVRQSNM